MSLQVSIEEDKRKAECFLLKKVKTEDGLVGRLISIYEDVFITTASEGKSITPVSLHLPCSYRSSFIDFLPINWKKRKWLFGCKETGTLELNYKDKKFICKESGLSYDFITEI